MNNKKTITQQQVEAAHKRKATPRLYLLHNSRRAHQNAVNHGFWEGNPSDEHFLMLVVTEISELIQADRKGRHSRYDYFLQRTRNSRICQGLDPEISKEEGYEVSFELTMKDTVEDEMADIAIRLLDLAGKHHIDFTTNKTKILWDADFWKQNTTTEIAYQLTRKITAPDLSIEIKIREALDFVFAWAANTLPTGMLQSQILAKMEYNETRPNKHNRKY